VNGAGWTLTIKARSSPKDRQKIRPRFRGAGAKRREAIVADLRRISVAPRMPRRCVIDRNPGRRRQSHPQNLRILGHKRLGALGQKPNHLPF
jgi:hypothetical protein